jgi:hypothetical protein
VIPQLGGVGFEDECSCHLYRGEARWIARH